MLGHFFNHREPPREEPIKPLSKSMQKRKERESIKAQENAAKTCTNDEALRIISLDLKDKNAWTSYLTRCGLLVPASFTMPFILKVLKGEKKLLKLKEVKALIVPKNTSFSA